MESRVATRYFQLSSSQTIIESHAPCPSLQVPRYAVLSSPRQRSTMRRKRSLICCSRESSESSHEDEFYESPQMHRVEVGPPAWVDVAIDRKAKDVGLPLSLRMIKRQMQWREGICGASESAYCSVKKAFSSLVYIIRELHSHTLYLREALLATGDIQTILARVQTEVHTSFVWLFQRVFSHTPTLMVSVMILLANFSVHSMASNVALATVEAAASSSIETEAHTIKPAISSPDVLAGGGGGGRKLNHVSSSMEGEGGRLGLYGYRTLVSNSDEKELSLWEAIVQESRERNGGLEDDTVKKLVAPVSGRIEPDDILDYYATSSTYQRELQKDPNNALLLANYAQFLYLVAKDYNRAEEFFKKAMIAEPKDPETFNKYGSFMWNVRKNMWAAEESLLEAIAVEPNNSFYAANYANFLWKTGGDDTCFFPLTLS